MQRCTYSFIYNPSGLVKPCFWFPDEFNCGDVREIDLLETWLNCELLNKFRKLRKRMLKEPCRSCSIKCVGGCRGVAAAVFGDILAPQPLCPLVEKSYMRR